MMQRLLTKYGLVSHVAFVVLFSLLLGTQSWVVSFAPLLWLSLIALELMVLLPSVRRGETLSDARRRLFHALAWDPFLYIGLAIVGVVLIQWVNGGCELIYLSDADVWQFSKPVVAWAPFSVEKSAAFAYVAVFSACIAVGLVLRVAVSKEAKRLLLQWLAGLSGGVSVYCVIQACRGIEPFAAKSLAQGTTSMGTFFAFWLLLGMGTFVDALARYQRGTVPLFLFGVAGNLIGMLFFASALALCVYGGLVLLLFFYWIIYLGPHVTKSVQLKLFLLSLSLVASVVLFLVFVFHDNPVSIKMKAALPVTTSWNALMGIKNIRTAAALGVWQEHPWMGVGADGFRHFAGLTVAGKDWGLMKTDSACVYNDSLQFLCEFGVLGIGLLLAAVVTLMVPVCFRARLVWKDDAHDENAGRFFLFRLSPIVVTGVLATLVCFLESWVSSPFRLCSIMLSWTCVMAVLPAFLPSQKLVAA